MRIPHVEDDAYILTLIRAAQLKVEEDTRQAFPGAKYKVLATGELVTLTRSKSPTVVHVKAGADEASLETVSTDDWELQKRYAFPRVEIDSSVDTTAVEVEYTTGTDDASLTILRMAVLQLVAAWYENRESNAPIELRAVPNNYADLVAMFSGIN